MGFYVRHLMYRQRRGLARVFMASALAASFLFVLSLLIFFVSPDFIAKNLEGRIISLFNIATSWSEKDPCGLMRSAVPVMAWGDKDGNYTGEIIPASLVTALLGPFKVDFRNPSDLIASGVPALAEYKRGPAAPAASGTAPEVASVVATPAENLTKDALVGIYHTHTGETYALTDGVERRPGGEKGGVVEVGRALKDTLEKSYGIRVAHSETVNDTDYRLAYAESEKTARRLLEENSNIQILLDIHRDAGEPRSQSVVKINGEEMAPILFIVGSDARLPFPSWKNNYNFALKLAGRLNKEYPGLCAGVRVKDGRYNQFLHPRALLVEIGTTNNSTPEAERSAQLLARVIAEELAEIVPDIVRLNAENPSRAGSDATR